VERISFSFCHSLILSCSDAPADDHLESDDEDIDETSFSTSLSAQNGKSESDDEDDDENAEDSALTPDDDDNDDYDDVESDDDDDDDDDESELVSIDKLRICELLKKCRTIVSTIRKSSILNDAVLLLARNASIKVELNLDMRVRWNSTFNMIDRLITYQSVLDQLFPQLDSLAGVTVKQRNKLLSCRPSDNDWTVLHALKRVLERFTDSTELLSGECYPTLSLGYVVVFGLAHYLNEQADVSVESSIKAMLRCQFEKYMVMPPHSKEAAMMRVAALLDPTVHDLLTADDKQMAEKTVISEVRVASHACSALQSG
jgi:hypothetical protein